MTGATALPCTHCHSVLHDHQLLEYLYCGHAKVVAFRFVEGNIDFVPVKSMDEAIAIIQESGQAAPPQPLPA